MKSSAGYPNYSNFITVWLDLAISVAKHFSCQKFCKPNFSAAKLPCYTTLRASAASKQAIVNKTCTVNKRSYEQYCDIINNFSKLVVKPSISTL